jgi:outer membrane lipoprotein-sorting protein
VRLIFRAMVCAILALGLAWACGRPANAGPAQEMLPEQSAAKAKQILAQVINALGGQAYLNVRDSDCTGQIKDFTVSVGGVADYTDFREQWLFPDKNRVEYHVKGEHPNILGLIMGGEDPTWVKQGGLVVTVFNGDQGWMLNKAGVSNQPDDVNKNFSEQLKTDMDHVLRVRRKEPGVEARYTGSDLIDLKEVEWIEFDDPEHHEIRLAVDKYTHLPLRWVVTTRDPETRERTEVFTSYIQYLTMDGVKVPLKLELTRNGRQITQTFLTECKFNSNVDPQLFTRETLEQTAARATKKGYKESKTTK